MIEKKFSKPTQSSVCASFLAADSCLNPAAIFVKTGSYWLLHVPSFVDFDMLAVKKKHFEKYMIMNSTVGRWHFKLGMIFP